MFKNVWKYILLNIFIRKKFKNEVITMTYHTIVVEPIFTTRILFNKRTYIFCYSQVRVYICFAIATRSVRDF